MLGSFKYMREKSFILIMAYMLQRGKKYTKVFWVLNYVEIEILTNTLVGFKARVSCYIFN